MSIIKHIHCLCIVSCVAGPVGCVPRCMIMPWCQVHLRTCTASIRTETDWTHAWTDSRTHATHTHTKQHYTQGHMSAYYMEGVSHRMRIMKISTSTIDLGFRFFLRQTLWEQGGGPRTFSVRFQVLTVSAFVPFRTPWHAMVRHGTFMCLCLLCPSLPSVGQLDPSWMPIYIYI